MKRRCLNPLDPAYVNYGGRGITIDSCWVHDYFAYKKYIETVLGPKPDNTASIDRIDNSLGYVPNNLRWASKNEQCENRRLFKTNTSGVRGLSLINGWWRVKRTIKTIRYLKFFKSRIDAENYIKNIELITTKEVA